jgi:glycosyltransferase involved in cell wall biosynthesis
VTAIIHASVIIITHNPRPHYLGRVLTALRGQTLSTEQWELLVVDNASDEPLTADAWDLSWHPRTKLIREDELGTSVARARGIREAAANLLVFVDDDNVLDHNYLAEALRIGREWPQLGVWGGSIVPEFEVEPPDYLRDYLCYLALREINTERWCNLSNFIGTDPWGAGMCLRASVAAEYCRLRAKSTIHIGRVGNLLSGEDTEMCYVAHYSLGLGMGLFPALKLVHLIPKERLKEDYLVNICTGIHTSLLLIDFKWRGILPGSPFSAIKLLRICKNVMVRRGIERRIYLAQLRAIVDARRIIAVTGKTASTSPLSSTIDLP